MTVSLSLNAPSHPAHTGWLRETSLAKIILECSESRFQGHLFLERGPQRVTLHLEAGSLFLAESTNEGQAVLAELGRLDALTTSQCEQVQAHARRQQCTETVALLALKCVPAIDILNALKNTSRKRALDCLAWPDGHYRLAQAEPQAGRSDASRIDLLNLVREGLTRHWSFEKLIEPFWPHVDSFPKPTSRFAALIQHLNTDLNPTDHIPMIDGTQSFTSAFHDALRSRPGAANLWILNQLGALTYTSPSPRTESIPDNPEPRIEIQVNQKSTAPGDPTRKPSRKPLSPSHPTAENIRAQIEKWSQALDQVDYFTLLGITPNASRGEVKTAYLAAAKTYHPDRLAALGLEDLRPTASEVFARMGEAFEILSDPTTRNDYEAMQRGEYSRQDAQRAAQAESFYRKAEVLIKMGDFDAAIDFLRPAVDLWGEEPEYQNALGWALFKKREPEFSAAADHLSLALKLQPSDDRIRERLHTVRLATPQAPEALSSNRDG